jgi:hypothetical protein
MIKPNFFIVGMPRSGTTALYIYLKQHPEVYLSIIKEPHYFGTDLPCLDSYVRDTELYSSLFENVTDEKIIGEGSVWYLESLLAAKELRAFNPEAKIVILLRNPVDMMVSLHALYLRTGNEEVEDFNEAIQLQESRKKNKSIPANVYFLQGLFYLDVALYYNKLKRFYETFEKDKIHVILFDELINHPHDTYQDLLKFLNLNTFKPVFELKMAEKAIQQKVLTQLKQSPIEIKNKIRVKRIYIHQKISEYNLSTQIKNKLLASFHYDLSVSSELSSRDLMRWIKS